MPAITPNLELHLFDFLHTINDVLRYMGNNIPVRVAIIRRYGILA